MKGSIKNIISKHEGGLIFEKSGYNLDQPGVGRADTEGISTPRHGARTLDQSERNVGLSDHRQPHPALAVLQK